MDTLTTHLLTFLAGLIAGAGLLYWLMPARRQASQVIRERDDARNALNHYRDQVDHHFLETADLVNELTQSYRAVHQHLSRGAHDLCSETGRKKAAAKSLDAAYEPEAPLSQPLDYAPKAQGTLSEDFGLQKKADGPFSPVNVDEDSSPSTVMEPPRDYADVRDDDDESDRPR
ncbi:MAG: YhcB family protein [Alcanivorax sp.]|nr:YhcB family protein [Alcanivorax sp.]